MGRSKSNAPKRAIAVFAVSAVIVIALLAYAGMRDRSKPLYAGQYQTLLEQGAIKSALIRGDTVVLQGEGATYTVARDAVDLPKLFQTVPVSHDDSMGWDELLLGVALVMMIAFLGLVFWRARKVPGSERNSSAMPEGGDMLGISHPIVPMNSNVTFRDVAGIGEVKDELSDIIDFLANPKKYIAFGARIPKGVILAGPPGVGKTMIAKAVAGEANVPFFYQSGSSFVQIFVGVGPKRVRELFATAKRHAPAIIFIDEIDAVGKARGAGRNDEREATLNQLLTEMDGFEENAGVIVIAATNKIEMLDEALLRAGRFDRRVFVSLPTLDERKAIASLYLTSVPNEVEIETVGRISVGFNAASMANLVNEAALLAIKESAARVTTDHVMRVRDKVMSGSRKILSFSDAEKRTIAVYQAARALMAYWYDLDFDKITLLGGGISGVDRELVSRNEMVGKVKFLLAGRAATEALLGQSYTYGADDLADARELVADMVEVYGMGRSVAGDPAEGATLMQALFVETKETLSQSKKFVDRIASVLLERESVSKAELRTLIDELF